VCARPRSGLGAHDEDRLALAACHRIERVVDQFLLRHADLAEHGPRVRGADAAGDHACGIGERPRSLGDDDPLDLP
jgi:hypothetical protein